MLFFMLKSRLSITLLDKTSKANAMHAHATPRMGGIGLVISALLIWLGWATYFEIESSSTLALICLITTLIFGISLIDDRRGLSAFKRLVFQFCAGATTIFLLDTKIWISEAYFLHGLALFLILFSVVMAIVWFANLYNFMDGINGLAGVMGIIGFASFAYAAYVDLSPTSDKIAVFSAAISGASAGFLYFNFPRARLFMGDCGSVTLGYLAATLGLFGATNQIWPWWFPLLVFSPFIVDASVTLARRIVKREHIWEGHRQHYYHRLILICGWSHTKVALAYAALMLSVSATGLYLLRTDNLFSVAETHQLSISTPSILWGWVVIYGLLLGYLEWRFLIQKQKKQ